MLINVLPAKDLARFIAHAHTPKTIHTVSQWAQENRILASRASSEAGPWRNSRTPFLCELMDCLSEHHPAEIVTFAKPTQIGGSECGLNWVGYFIDRCYGSMLIVLPILDLATLYSRQRLAPMIELTPALNKKVPSNRTRDGGNTMLLKEYSGGVIRLAGANSPAGLASMPARCILFDDVDRFPISAGDEGDPIDLALHRSSTFPNRKAFINSSPTIKGLSRVWHWLENSDYREYHVPCPHCAEYQTLVFENLVEQDNEVYYACNHCGAFISETNKTQMLSAGKWIAKKPKNENPGFHINGLYAPEGLGDSWKKIIDSAKLARNDPVKWQVFVNTVLSLPYEDQTATITAEVIQRGAGGHRLGFIPAGGLYLTAGVDTQDNRLSVQVAAWGRGERAWIIDWFEIMGSPAEQSTWEKLDTALAKTYPHESKSEMKIEVTFIDSGGNHTHEVYNYCRSRQLRNIHAIKGASQPSKPIIGTRPTLQDVSFRGRFDKRGVKLWFVGVNKAKTTLFNRLLADVARDKNQPNFINFPDSTSDDLSTDNNLLHYDYYNQLTAERYNPAAGRWENPKRQRNEALDTLVYSYAAALSPYLMIHRKSEREWKIREQQLLPDLFSQAENKPTPTPPPSAQSTQTRRAKSSYLNR